MTTGSPTGCRQPTCRGRNRRWRRRAARERCSDAPAKVNLNLKVTGRRADGYHLLDSTVIFTAFGDRLTVRPAAGEDSFDVTGPFATLLEDETDNICLRAINGYRAIGGAVGPLAVTVEKNIPVGAGLGGGSSDAAAMLRYLDRQATHRIDPDALAALAADLGADVPVCLAGVASRMRGIGDILDPVDPAPNGHIVLARPDAMLPTPAVFRAFAGSGTGFAKNIVAPDGRTARQIVEDGNDLACNGESSLPRDRPAARGAAKLPRRRGRADDGKRFGLFRPVRGRAAGRRRRGANDGGRALGGGVQLLGFGRPAGDHLPERHLLPLWCVIGLDWPDIGRYIAPTLRLGRSQVVRHRFLVPCIVGSNPTAPANLATIPMS